MRFYKHAHAFYCGVDLHARSMFTHILDHDGKTVFEADLPAGPDAFRNAIAPYRAGLVVGCECMFSWYWLADLTQPRLPTCRADYELSRCAAIADHEFRRGLDSLGTLPAIARHLSRIELADLLGLHVARRGFWDAAFPNSLGRKEETTPSARGNTSWPDPVELFGAVSVSPRMDAVA